MLCNLPCRIVLIVINIITGLVGLISLAFGALMIWGQDVLKNILNDVLVPLLNAVGSNTDAPQVADLLTRIITTASPIGIVLFSFGAAVFILSLIGYCGATCNIKILLYVYASIIGVLAICLLICVILYFIFKDQFADRAVELYAKAVCNYTAMKDKTVDVLLVGLIQPALHCCGVNSSADFKHMSKSDVYEGITYTNIAVPIPCCILNPNLGLVDYACPNFPSLNNSYIDQGCKDPLKDAFIHYMNYTAYGLIAVIIILVLLILFTLLTACIDFV